MSKYRSYEEAYFAIWLRDAENLGLLTGWSYEGMSYELSPKISAKKTVQLKTKTKDINKHLMHGHSYTPDFEFNLLMPCPPLIAIFNGSFCNTGHCVVDVKGMWANRGGTQEFSINQKWMYQKFRIYVQKIKIPDFFRKTWLPAGAGLGKRGGILKAYRGLPTIEEWESGK